MSAFNMGEKLCKEYGCLCATCEHRHTSFKKCETSCLCCDPYAARFIRVRYGGIRRNIKMRELFQEEGDKVDEQGNFNGSPYT